MMPVSNRRFDPPFPVKVNATKLDNDETLFTLSVPDLLTLSWVTVPTCKSKSLLVAALFVLVAFTFNAVNTVGKSFHVWLIVTGALDDSDGEVSVRLAKVGLSLVPNPKLVLAVPAVGVSSLRLFAANRSPVPLPPETGNQSKTPPALIPKNSPGTPSFGMSCTFNGGSWKE